MTSLCSAGPFCFSPRLNWNNIITNISTLIHIQSQEVAHRLLPILPFALVTGAPLQVVLLCPYPPHLLHFFLPLFSAVTSSTPNILLFLGLPGGLTSGGGVTLCCGYTKCKDHIVKNLVVLYRKKNILYKQVQYLRPIR